MFKFAGTAIFTFFVVASANAADPAIPASGKTANDFVPQGWAILEKAEGDLNKDGLPDLALALKNNAEDKDRPLGDQDDIPRLLVILFKTPQGYEKSMVSDRAIFCKQCGGVFGDPFAGMKIDRGVLVIDIYGGSSWRWGGTDRWRFQDGDWYLIGQRKFTEYTMGPEASSTDTNFLTGDQIIESTSDLGVKKVEKKKIAKAPLQKISTYKPF